MQANKGGSSSSVTELAQQKPAKKKPASSQHTQAVAHTSKAESAHSEDEPEVLPAESAIVDDPEVSGDQGGSEFDAKAADVQTPVGAQG